MIEALIGCGIAWAGGFAIGLCVGHQIRCRSVSSKPQPRPERQHDPYRATLAGHAVRVGYDHPERYPGLYEAAGEVCSEESTLKQTADVGGFTDLDEIAEAFWKYEEKRGRR